MSPPAAAEPSVEERVVALLSQWEADCAHLSNSTRRRQHPALQKIADLGMASVPTLIKHYHRAPRTLEALLRRITTASPSDGLESFEEWRAAWIGWARARGLTV
jgi:hypothetical protein